jgi:SHS2 domain-containing protein
LEIALKILPARSPALQIPSMYTFLDHPSEALVEVVANSESEVFRDASLALFDLMTDITKIEIHERFPVQLESSERHLLLIDWLNRLILLHEVEHVFLKEFNVQIEKNSCWSLVAVVGGEKIRDNHERRLHAKSATYGQLEWKEGAGSHEVRFVIDV